MRGRPGLHLSTFAVSSVFFVAASYLDFLDLKRFWDCFAVTGQDVDECLLGDVRLRTIISLNDFFNTTLLNRLQVI